MSLGLFSTFGAFFASFGLSLLRAIIYFVIGYVVIKIVLKIDSKILGKSRIEKSARKFLYNFVKYILYLLLIMIIVSALGVSITGFVAILSAAGLAISLALQGSLSNLANGIVIIISKPFKEGDNVSVSGFTGTVKEIKLTHTILLSVDNKEISVPNKIIVENVIVNTSTLQTKKLMYSFLVGYSSDVDKVKNIILGSFAKTNYVLTDPKPYVAVDALEQNGVKFVASAYVESKHYVETYHPILEDIFNEFKKEKIVLPYAHLKIKMVTEKENKTQRKNTRTCTARDRSWLFKFCRWNWSNWRTRLGSRDFAKFYWWKQQTRRNKWSRNKAVKSKHCRQT